MDARMCPRCRCKSVVKDIRSKVGLAVRSRTCPVCGRKWQTVEVERWHYDILLTKAGRRGESMVTKEAKFGAWVYYINDEGKARWKCDQCGKICKHNPYYKQYCSKCGAKMRMEA